MKYLRPILFMFLVFALALPAAWGQTRPMMNCQERFDQMDGNKDGKVTLEEFRSVAHHRNVPEQMFSTISKGKDHITADEFCSGDKGGGMGRGSGKGMGKAK